MSDFDFLSRVPIGQFVSTGSYIHKLDARTKISLFTLVFIALSFSKSILGTSIGLVFISCLLIISKIDIKFAIKSLLASLPFLILFAIVQIFFYSSANDPQILISIWKIKITLSGLLAGGILLVRFTALILCLTLASFSVSTTELIQGFQKILSPLNIFRIKTMDVVMVLQITLRFVPLLIQTSERITKAQASRGADWGSKTKGIMNKIKQIIPLVVPLFVISLKRAEALALAMDARAYGLLSHRTSMMEMKFKPRDFLMLITAMGISFTIFYF